ncbi:site-specific integrase [Dechloromonas sp. CZR5]|uniref:site-specific integrase n=1 Tax=Dechloromonas sp. CZR5 TaxID=2608630 RepID=UPI00123E3E9D|nr:site-specific integrase [Dechloromonas sp. CZR5]
MRDVFRIPDLSFPKMSYGEMETPWDLRALLYRGGAAARRNKVLEMIDTGKLGDPMPERLELVQRIHESIDDRFVGGGSPSTVDASIEAVRRLFAWADQAGQQLTLDTIEAIYLHWTDAMDHRSRVVRDLSQDSAYQQAAVVGTLLDRTLERLTPIIEGTRIKRSPQRKTAHGIQAEKQNLQDTFAFGHLLQDICDGLPANVVLNGSLPVLIPLRNGGQLVEWSGYTRAKVVAELPNRILDSSSKRYKAKKSRERWAVFESDCTLRTRFPLANLRIMAELHMFVGQTGMNLAQVFQLKLRHFWYASHLDGYQVKDRKCRRGGEVLFEIFREYKPHFERYLAWRRELFPDSDLLFPLVIIYGRSEKKAPSFERLRGVCKTLGGPYIPPAALRNTRVNWLLRRSGDPDLTAEMDQHTKETLLDVYQRPSLQRAMGEVMRFWAKSDPALSRTVPAAPGECDGQPVPMKNTPKDATVPDCIQASGCLWCEHHRDIDSQDYCWSLACFRHLKVIEVSKWHAPLGSRQTHPAEFAIDRISGKLRWFYESNSKRRGWVDEAMARVEEGSYHPDWKRLIEDMEGAA